MQQRAVQAGVGQPPSALAHPAQGRHHQGVAEDHYHHYHQVDDGVGVGVGHVQRAGGAEVQEAPGAGVLQAVGAQAEEREGPEEQDEEPEDDDHRPGRAGSAVLGVEVGALERQAPLDGHGADDERGGQAEADHDEGVKAAELVHRGHPAPVDVAGEGHRGGQADTHQVVPGEGGHQRVEHHAADLRPRPVQHHQGQHVADQPWNTERRLQSVFNNSGNILHISAETRNTVFSLSLATPVTFYISALKHKI